MLSTPVAVIDYGASADLYENVDIGLSKEITFHLPLTFWYPFTVPGKWGMEGLVETDKKHEYL